MSMVLVLKAEGALEEQYYSCQLMIMDYGFWADGAQFFFLFRFDCNCNCVHYRTVPLHPPPIAVNINSFHEASCRVL